MQACTYVDTICAHIIMCAQLFSLNYGMHLNICRFSPLHHNLAAYQVMTGMQLNNVL